MLTWDIAITQIQSNTIYLRGSISWTELMTFDISDFWNNLVQNIEPICIINEPPHLFDRVYVIRIPLSTNRLFILTNVLIINYYISVLRAFHDRTHVGKLLGRARLRCMAISRWGYPKINYPSFEFSQRDMRYAVCCWVHDT